MFSLHRLVPWLALAPLGAQVHTHGDMVGSVTTSAAIVWTRASTDALVSVLVATDPGLAGASETAWVVAGASTDFTARVPLAGLQPATQYHYATRLRNLGGSITATGPTSRFRTAALPGSLPRVEILMSGDVNSTAQYDIFTQMQVLGADLYLHLGDMPYADGSVTLADYWAKHKALRGDARFQSFFRSLAIEPVWDDHEIVNDWDADTSPSLVATGRAAWFHYFPFPTGTTQVYRSFKRGDTVEVFVVDTRTYRGSNPAADVPSKSLLGATQLAWLEQGLANSTALFKVVATSVPLRFATTVKDSWDGYMWERAALLQFIADHGIENVLFVTADQHWAASHAHPEGVHEFQTGPLATSTRTPQLPEPELLWLDVQRNFGRLTLDPTVSPARVTMDWYGVGGILRSEVFHAAQSGRVQVTADLHEGGFMLDGPEFDFRGAGRATALPRVPAGSYTARFRSIDGGDAAPAELTVDVPANGDVAIAADWHDTDFAGHAVLLAEDFATPLAGWAVRDEGTNGAPSSWFANSGALFQSSNIFTTTADVSMPGTLATRGNVAWTDYTLHARARSWDNDGFGLLVRYVDNDNYYRFSMDQERAYRRLVKKRNGVFTLLAADTVPFTTYRWYDFDVVAIGNRIRVLVDGQTVFDVIDNDLPAGAIGLYTWGNHMTAFDELVVRTGDTTSLTPPVIVSEAFNAPLSGWSVVDEGTVSAPSSWSVAAGVLNQTSNIYDGDMNGANVPKLGSMLLHPAVASDFEFSVDLRNADNDAIGAVFRYTSPNDYYRFSMDQERAYRRLVRRANGAWTTLWQVAGGYAQSTWYELTIRAVGNDITVLLDGIEVAHVQDATHGSGRCGLYVWGSDAASFDDFMIAPAAPPRPVFAAIEDGQTTTFRGKAPRAIGRAYSLVLSGGRSPGIPLALVQAGDPRTLEIEPDGLFWATLQGGPLFVGFAGGTVGPDGSVTGQVTWPVLPILTGLQLYAGGWTWRADGTIGELLPTVGTKFP